MSLTLWLALAGVMLLVAMCYGLPLWRRMRAYAAFCSTCGNLPDKPTARAHRFFKRLSRFLLFVQVGKVRWEGLENFNTPGPKLIAPNHGHSVDPAPYSLVLDEPARYMAAGGVFRFAWGLGSLFAGPCGAFCADLTPGKGGPAREVAVRVLVSGQTLVMFPEGWAWMDGVMGPLKKGAVRIVRQAGQTLGSPVYLVPCYMRYGRHPGPWIRRFPPPLQYLIVLLGFLYFRGGLTIVVGKPISSADLPADDQVATDMLRDAIQSLNPALSKSRIPAEAP